MSNLLRSTLFLLLPVGALACGPDVDKIDDPTNNVVANGSTNSVENAQTNNIASSNGQTNNGQTNNVIEGPVAVECVSELVTSQGNYYAVTAEVDEAEARIDLINYHAATPTSDPTEESIWSDVVAATLTPERFAFEVEQHYLDVEKAPEEAMYRGTMSGETQFGDVVPVTCWPVDLEHPASYDATTGSCVDADGLSAMNEIPWMVALRTGFGQCAQFEGSLSGEATGATFDFIDLRGADFSSATARNTIVQEVQLEGADLSQLTIESSSVSGTMDENTSLPPSGCEVAEDEASFACVN